MTKIVQISDTHIRTYQRHQEYKEIFKQIYDILKKECPDYIIHCGDLVHSKINISNEMVLLAADFLKNLADIAKTYIIVGNHDLGLKSLNRIDSITPVVNLLKHPNLHYLKYSQEIDIGNNIVLNHLSILDKENWKLIPSNPEKINIFLYHGTINGAVTDLGWTVTNGDIGLEDFKNADYVFAGDIHKTNQILDNNGKARFVGSTIQQNFSEEDSKGFLTWEIESKEVFTCCHISVPNPKPFISVNLTEEGKLPDNVTILKNARVRLIAENNLPIETIRRVIDQTKYQYSPENVSFLSRATNKGNISEQHTKLFSENLRDVTVQEKLIKEYLKDYNLKKEILNRIFELNKKYNSVLVQDEDIMRNVKWKLKSLSWDNLYNYDEGNKIDFEKIKGVAGVFGPNFFGKSSLVLALIYTLFNTSTKGIRKNLSIINQNKEWGTGTVEFEIDEEKYIVTRKSEKYLKKLKGEETLEAKTDVIFEKIYNNKIEQINGITRNDTDKNIRNTIGTIEDFLITSMTDQFGALTFINEGSTKRKEILAKFLDLEVFDQKFKLAKEESSEVRMALKRLEEKDLKNIIIKTQGDIGQASSNIKKQKLLCHEYKTQFEIINKEISELDNKINTSPRNLIIDIEQILKNLQKKEKDLLVLKEENERRENILLSDKEQIKKIEKFISEIFDIEEYKNKKKEISEKEKEIEQISYDIKDIDRKINQNEKKKELLKEVPCGSEYPTCKFIKDAHLASNNIQKLQQSLNELQEKVDAVKNSIEVLNPEKINDFIQKYNKLVERKSSISSSILQNELQIQKNNIEVLKIEQEIVNLKLEEQKWRENKEKIEEIKTTIEQKNEKQKIKKEISSKIAECENQIYNMVKINGSLEQKLEDLKNQSEERQTLREQYEAMDLFLKCFHSNGISYDIIKRKLPVVNEEINKILSSIVNFQVYFDNRDDKLEIYLKHPKHEARTLDTGSGSEKSLSAFAIRLALMKVTTLPTSNILILDEPASELDEEHLEGFTRILEMLKTEFDTIILISHLEYLKDCVDQQIVIEKRNGYAHIEV